MRTGSNESLVVPLALAFQLGLTETTYKLCGFESRLLHSIFLNELKRRAYKHRYYSSAG